MSSVCQRARLTRVVGSSSSLITKVNKLANFELHRRLATGHYTFGQEQWSNYAFHKKASTHDECVCCKDGEFEMAFIVCIFDQFKMFEMFHVPF